MRNFTLLPFLFSMYYHNHTQLYIQTQPKQLKQGEKKETQLGLPHTQLSFGVDFRKLRHRCPCVAPRR